MRLLLADDNEMNLELFSDALEADGHEVVVERNGLRARDRALGEKFDLVILDIQMPGMDGYAVCAALRSRGVSIPIVALSSAAMARQVQRGHDVGFDDYLTKPLSPADLRSAVRRFEPGA